RKARALRGRNVQQWLSEETSDERARELIALLVRLGCYAHAPDLLGAEAAARQLAHVVKHSVMYVDGGWQSLIDAVLARAEAAGVQLDLGVAVERIEHAGSAVRAVVTRDGRRVPARAVVAAVEPAVLAALLPGDARARRWADAAVPLRAACLDLGVRGLPHPERFSVHALEAPLYFANHSAYAQLAPDGASVLHLIRYLAPGEDGRGAEPELRAFLERVQPGVYARAETKRFAPNLVVHNDLPGPERARGEHPELAGLHLVGDGCSARAMLTDGVLDSAHAAAARIAERMPVLGISARPGRAPAVVKTAAASDPGRAA
ncbi:MAG TPA: FAD-dependent oxidoreductase, partial [Polyangiales bacterium]|nr:FAD-dependent oxidoreductase [Polyangiales bacterium]